RLLLCLFVTLFVLMHGQTSTQAADPSIDATYYVYTAKDLQNYMSRDGNFKIIVSVNLDAKIERTKYWCTLGKGTKVLELLGNSISISCNHQDVNASVPLCLFLVNDGSELVINDTLGGGRVHYDGLLAEVNDSGYYKSVRNLVEVNGGSFTLNGGAMEAGRSQKYWSAADAKYYWRQINGAAVVMYRGTVTINGGIVQGRGYIYGDPYVDRNNRSRTAAILAMGGALTVYDGEFWGKGDADVLSLTKNVEVRIFGGAFETHKFDHKIASESMDLGYSGGGFGRESWGFISHSGKIGIPARATAAGKEVTNFYLKGKLMSDSACEKGDADNTSACVTVSPKDSKGDLVYETAYDPAPVIYTDTAEKVFDWDKKKQLALGIHEKPYFPMPRSIDTFEKHEFPQYTVTIATSPDARKGVNDTLTDFPAKVNGKVDEQGYFDNTCMVDLDTIPTEALADLKINRNYYVILKAKESWKNARSYERKIEPIQKKVKIHIVGTDDTWWRGDIDLKYQNRPNKAKQMCDFAIIPAGFGGQGNLNLLKSKGIMDEYEVTLSYDGTDGTRKTKTFNSSNLLEDWTVSNARCGTNRLEYDLRLYKDEELICEKHTEIQAVHFPYFTTDPVSGEGDAIMFNESDSDKTVRISVNADNVEGLYWTRDDNENGAVGSSKTREVTLNSSADTSWYSLGYTIDGQKYISPQQVIIGVKESNRLVDLTADKTGCVITDDEDPTPLFTATTSGSDWGNNLSYKWCYNCYPADGSASYFHRLSVDNVSEKTATRSLAEIAGYAGHPLKATGLVEGTYKVYCKVIDNKNNRSVQTKVIAVSVQHSVGGMKILSHDLLSPSAFGDKYISYDVTDSFIVIPEQDALAKLSLEATPENARFHNPISFTSSDTEIADLNMSYNDGSCLISGSKPGCATVSWTTQGVKGVAAGSTTVLTPRNRYSVTVPQQWLEAKVGNAVVQGELSVPTSEDFTAELIWYKKNSWTNAPCESGELFAGEQEYYPVIRIYPKQGVGYPGWLEDGVSCLYYNIDKNAYVITVNGIEYYGASNCNRPYFSIAKGLQILSAADYGKLPVSEGKKMEDYIDLELASTGKLIDPKDDYLNRITFTLDQPMPGSPKDQTEDTITNLSYSILTEGVSCGGDSVVHITDPATIEDDIITNDKSEEAFTTYEEGQTYRASVWLVGDSKYRNAAGGKLYFSDNMEVVEPECRTILDTSVFKTGQMRQVYVYFTINPGDQDVTTTQPTPTPTPGTDDPDPDNGQTSPGETTVAGKPVTTVEETITASGSEKDLEGAAFSLLQAKG
ncbi:MAG: hypothetical protein K6E18_02260, partial [Lachnospiraceae bacterium]|nr:hypothetical protein [Lachnospiraceae bacterium]